MSTAGAQRKFDAFNAAHAQKKLPYYEILGVSETASQAEIVRVYRKRSLKLHPDKPGGSNEQFQELNKAYKCLKDPENRRKYDDCGFDEDNIDTDEVDTFVDAFFGETARGLDGRSGDWSCNDVTNYRRIDLAQIPLHMKDIVRIGLGYIVALDHDFENVVLLQHSRIDILYLMVGMWTAGDLTQKLFESEDSYPITYYDNPLQPGIIPYWSDQNVLGSKKHKVAKKDLPTRELNFEEFQRRQKIALAMLENGPVDPMAALEEKYRIKMLETQHQRALTSSELRREAIRGQEIYEDDAELDCNAYTDLLATNRKSNDAELELPGSNPYAEFLAIERCVEGSAASQQACLELDEAEKANNSLHTDTIAEYASVGREEVLGMSSDGVIFAAKDGKVLRNENVLMPVPASKDDLASRNENVSTPCQDNSMVQPAPASWIVSALGCFPMLGCLLRH